MLEQMMPKGMTARIAAADVDPFALQEPPVGRRRITRRALIFAALGMIAYLIGMIALIPARMILTESENLRVGGTIWNGEAVLASTIRADWQFSPVLSFSDLAFGAQFRLAGGSTDLAGDASIAGGTMSFRNVSGQLDETLTTALNSNLQVRCSFVADVAMDRLVVGGSEQRADGSMTLSPATCAPSGAAAVPAELPTSRFAIVPGNGSSTGALVSVAGRQQLLEVRYSRDGALSIWPTAAMVQMAPFLAGVRYDTKID